MDQIDMENPGVEMMKAAGEGAGRESVDKIACALGAAFPFWGMKKRAVEVYIKAIESGNYTPDEKYLLIAGAKKHCKELENQMAIAEIAQSQAKDGTDFSMNSTVSDEWLSRLLEAGKFVSDKDAQLLWGSILAGEFEEPGSTPPGTIRILSELSQEYATIFSNLCSLSVDLLLDTGTDIVIDPDCCLIDTETDSPYLENLGLTFEMLQEFEQLGLLNFNAISGFNNVLSVKKYPKIHVVYGSNVLSVTKYSDKEFPGGHIYLTKAGRCISRFTKRKIIPEHLDAIRTYMQKKHVEFSAYPELRIVSLEGKSGYSYARISNVIVHMEKRQ